MGDRARRSLARGDEVPDERTGGGALERVGERIARWRSEHGGPGVRWSAFRYRSRVVTLDDVVFLRDLIASRPEASRRTLSIAVCNACGWRQPNGTLCDAVCRGLLLALHRGGIVKLPPPKRTPRGAAWARHRPAPIELDTAPIEMSLRELGAIELRQVRRTPEEALVNSLIEHHHYLRYSQPVGEHLKYLVTARGRPIGAFWVEARTT